MSTDTTINAAHYHETFKKLSYNSKSNGMLTKGVWFPHNNAHPHTAHETAKLYAQFGWHILTRPPYSPDLALSYFHLFLELKSHLGGMYFPRDELKTKVKHYLHDAAGVL